MVDTKQSSKKIILLRRQLETFSGGLQKQQQKHTNSFVSEDQSQPSDEIGGVRREGVFSARLPRGGVRPEGVLTMRGCSSCEVQPF